MARWTIDEVQLCNEGDEGQLSEPWLTVRRRICIRWRLARHGGQLAAKWRLCDEKQRYWHNLRLKQWSISERQQQLHRILIHKFTAISYCCCCLLLAACCWFLWIWLLLLSWDLHNSINNQSTAARQRPATIDCCWLYSMLSILLGFIYLYITTAVAVAIILAMCVVDV